MYGYVIWVREDDDREAVVYSKRFRLFSTHLMGIDPKSYVMRRVMFALCDVGLVSGWPCVIEC